MQRQILACYNAQAKTKSLKATSNHFKEEE